MPSIEDDVVDRIACRPGALEWCDVKYNIKVKNCSTFFVYYLPPTQTRNEGYCFGNYAKTYTTHFAGNIVTDIYIA